MPAAMVFAMLQRAAFTDNLPELTLRVAPLIRRRRARSAMGFAAGLVVGFALAVIFTTSLHAGAHDDVSAMLVLLTSAVVAGRAAGQPIARS
jgi:lipopolysaccharide export LptBFGC system permease protein LptF